MVWMRGNLGKMLFVVPAYEGLSIAKELIGVVRVVAITIDSNLKHIVGDQFSPQLERKLTR